jgi:hypothetical protein
MSSSRGPDGRFPKGTSGNPGGRPRQLRDLEPVLDEHRSAESMRAVFAKLRDLGLGGDVAAMKLYLDRILGPVRVEYEDASLTPDEERALEEVKRIPGVAEVLRRNGVEV